MALYPGNSLQNDVEFMQQGKAGFYPITATPRDDIDTGMFKSTLAKGTAVNVGSAVVWDTDGYRPTVAGDLKIDGVVVFGYGLQVQNETTYKKADLDVNFPVKKRGLVYVNVLNNVLTGFAKKVEVALNAADGTFKVAVTGDTVVGIVEELFPAYNTIEMFILEAPYVKA